MADAPTQTVATTDASGTRMVAAFTDELAEQLLSAWPPLAPIKPILAALFTQAVTGACGGGARVGVPVAVTQVVTFLADGAKTNDVPYAAARNLGSALLGLTPFELTEATDASAGGSTSILSAKSAPLLTVTKLPVPPVWPKQWTPDEIYRWIRQIGGPAGKLAKRELQDLPGRLSAAAAIQAAAALSPFINSNMNAGTKVHKILQQDYRRALLMQDNLITTDRCIWGQKGGRIFSGERLRDAAESSGIPELHIAYYAWTKMADAYIVSIRSVRRSDITNFTHMNSGLMVAPSPGIAAYGENWEIKPMGDAISGVLQECFYRMSYNLYRLSIQYDKGQPLTAELRPGVHWPGALVGTGIPVNDGMVNFAIPFTAPRILPGLMLYAPVRGLTMYELVQLAALLAKLLQKTLKEIGDIYEEIRKVGAIVLGFVLGFLKVVAMIAAVLGLAALIFAGGPIAWLAEATAAIILIVLGSKGGQRQPSGFPDGLYCSFGEVAVDIEGALAAKDVARMIAAFASAYCSGLRSMCESMTSVLSTVSSAIPVAPPR